VSFRIAGTYLEACNCDAICPCRTIDGMTGGRSTHGVCFGALSWWVDEGQAADVDLAGAGAVMTYSYDDDEPGSPWTLVLYVDGPDELGQILLGRLGGGHVLTLPWVRKPTTSVEVRHAEISFGNGDVRVGDAVRLRATTPYGTDAAVSCIVPGHDRPGTELINDEVVVDDPPFGFELRGTCAFRREFDYRG
jgi:Protein of unknown function (DUF1326)